MIVPRRAAAYARKGVWFVCPEHRASAGFWRVGEPVHVVAHDAYRLGEAVSACLTLSQPSVAIDRDRRNDLPTVAVQAGATSWSNFLKGAYEYSIEDEGGSITITKESENGRERSLPVAVDGSSALEIGEALISSRGS